MLRSKKRSKLIALVLSVSMVFTMIPQIAGFVYADSTPIDPQFILFESSADGGKISESLGENRRNYILTEVGPLTDDRKYTLKDYGSADSFGNDHEGFEAGPAVAYEDGYLRINYSGAATGDEEYISAIIRNQNGTITYYGRLAETKTTGSSGFVNVDIADKIHEGDYLYIFNEQYNGDRKTDFASQLVKMDIVDGEIPSIEFSSDSNGEIYDWTFRGDANCDQKITGEDWNIIRQCVNEGEGYQDYQDTPREIRNEAALGRGDTVDNVSASDWIYVRTLVLGLMQLPSISGVEFDLNTSYPNAFTFEVKDKPNKGYEISKVTVNGKNLSLPEKGSSATTTVDALTYTVTIDEEGKGAVSGKSLYSNSIAFEHKLTEQDAQENDTPDPEEENEQGQGGENRQNVQDPEGQNGQDRDGQNGQNDTNGETDSNDSDSNGSDSSTRTGDESVIALYAFLMVIAAATIAVIIYRRRVSAR